MVHSLYHMKGPIKGSIIPSPTYIDAFVFHSCAFIHKELRPIFSAVGFIMT
jgi:hypothetical protein